MDTEYGSRPTFVVPIGAILTVIAVIVVVMRLRRPSEDERALAPIVSAIEDAELPEAAKEILEESVNQVRQALSSLRAMASELAQES